ncbi:MAG: hypothetical protein LH650_06940, partial [Chloroflexi bacterium]|nr:hypothetical protein [Chloroflexota bacterium]
MTVPNDIPDPMTDPVTGPVVDRLERFLAANTIQPPEDLVQRVRERLALEPRPSQPRRLAGLAHRDADAAFGRRPDGAQMWLRAPAVIAILVVAGGVAGVAGVWFLRSMADGVGGPATSPTTPVVSPSPSGSPGPSSSPVLVMPVVVVPEVTPTAPAETPATSVVRTTTRGDAAHADWDPAPRRTVPAATHGVVGVAAVSSPASTATARPQTTPEPSAEPTPEPSAEPTVAPTPE